MKTFIAAHEQGYTLSLTKSPREKEGWVMLDSRYGESDDLRIQISVNVKELQAALKAFE